MKRPLSRKETEFRNLMLKKLSPELITKMQSSGCDIVINWESGEFDVVDCPEDLRQEILSELRRQR